MTPYKILRIVYDWPPPWDGLAPAPYELSKSQITLGNKVIALTGGLGGRKLIRREFKKVDDGGKLIVYNLPRGLKKFGPFLTTSIFVIPYYLFLRIFKKINIVHGHGHIMLWFNIYKLIFGRIDKIPYVAHFHITGAGREDLLIKRGYKLDFFTRFFEYPLHKLSDRIGVKVANACVFVSKELINEAEKFYNADRTKCFLVESGVNTYIFKENRNIKREKHILFVGMVDPRKSPDLIIKSLKYLKGFKAVFIGRGADSYIEELLELARIEKVENRIEFKGYVPYSEILPFYRTCAVFVLPSLYEGLPKVVLEALSCGTPVVASGFEVKSPITGLYIAQSFTPKDLADRIEIISKSNQKVDTEFIEKYYSWNSRAEEVQRIYEKVSIKRSK
ncbi:MAG: glycosyltransferase family 4 protein [bacterium]